MVTESGHFRQGGLDMVGGGELGARERRRDQGVMREEIDLAREARGGLEEGFLGGGIEERDRGTGEAAGDGRDSR